MDHQTMIGLKCLSKIYLDGNIYDLLHEQVWCVIFGVQYLRLPQRPPICD
ncbi:hypothetical protein TRIP_C20068 [Candidatus Zixiibacteriota bacterium]|nr:hypothetical protein TRIP_C20068 [candidate division Zixibacteria bacterium]